MTTPPNNTTEPPADRGVPSIALPPISRKLFTIVLLGFAGVAIAYLLGSDLNKDVPKPLTEPKEVVFRSPGGTAPYIADSPTGGSSAPQNADPLASQKELALQQEALRMAREQQKKLEARLRSPMLVYDQPASGTQQPVGTSVNPAPGAIVLNTGNPGTSGADDPNLAFASQNAGKDIETAEASRLQNLHALIPQGTLISGILETAIQSDLPGMVRAIVSENIYSFDATRLLIPQGARLIGQYRSGLVRGQSRVFVIWNRLIRNDGVSVNIGSSGTDELGRSGLNGEVDTHFFERFGSSVLLSMIDSGLQVGTGALSNENAATVAVNTGGDFSKAAEIALQNSVAIPPTVNIDQGTRINVFVGKDLDFSHVAGNQPAE